MEKRGRAPSLRSGVRRAARRLLVLTVLVVVLMGVLSAGQRTLVYLPDPAAPPPVEQVLPQGRDVVLRTSDGLDLGASASRSPAPRRISSRTWC